VRLALAAAILLALFALAVSLLRRAGSQPAPHEPVPALPPGWGSVVVGAPSGAQPATDVQPRVPAPAPAPQPAPPPLPEPQAAREFELTVSPGQTLSAICKEHYGTASVALVESLARFNQLASADAVRAGQKLRLPPLATLQKP
jgi:nucleoid-associated protein YgaU